MNRFRLSAAMAFMLALLACVPFAASADDDYSSLELSGDIITAIVPAAAYWMIKSRDDDPGEGQFLRSVGASLVLNTTLRVGLNKTSFGTRPNGSPYGFPSGHVAFLTSSAAFLQDRYGWRYGLPAYALTGYVAWIRVDTDHHRWRDVIAGAALSYGVSKLFVTPEKAIRLAPVIGPDWLGMRWERSF